MATLEGFLFNTRYCRDDLEYPKKQAALLTQSCNYVLLEIASRWRNVEPSIMAGDQAGSLEPSFSARQQSGLGKKKENRRRAQPYSKRGFVDICVTYCRTEASAAGHRVSRLGIILRYMCEKKTDMADQKKGCGQKDQQFIAQVL